MSHERDDIIEPSLYTHHSEEEGKKKRRKIWMVTLILSIVTIVEVLLGANVKQGPSATWFTVKVLFVLLTVVKAGYIVLSFMHMGDEVRTFRWMVLVTYLVFIVYLVYISLMEGTSVGVSFY